MQQIGRFIPMTYAAQAMRDIMIRNATLGDLILPMGTLAGAAVLLLVIGIILYNRWVQRERD
jgi:ABC-2 type transport system permease protein